MSAPGEEKQNKINLNASCPQMRSLLCSVLLAVLPQLEFKLKSTEENERMGSVSLLARMFSEKVFYKFIYSILNSSSTQAVNVPS